MTTPTTEAYEALRGLYTELAADVLESRAELAKAAEREEALKADADALRGALLGILDSEEGMVAGGLRVSLSPAQVAALREVTGGGQ
jgi:hypothetical protein